MVIILWLFLTFISCVILYLIIKAAINHSEISKAGSEIRSLQVQLNRQHQEMSKQLELLRLTISENNKGNNIDKLI
ncbi:hypothetical protein [Gorillibacterium massiliense]|uniref:hypothetical protein n=1 Tax=Gorillibacterium massiliense TaxID=1280390 RepID=UPI0005953FC9|nr:hypothetical protein [Gorillibacterium massiliense]